MTLIRPEKSTHNEIVYWRIAREIATPCTGAIRESEITQPSHPCTTCTGCPANWRDGWISESAVGFEPTSISFAD